MDDYETYKQECNLIKEENALFLKEYHDWLISKGISEKSTKVHVTNTDFFINEFLLSDDSTSAKEGYSSVGHPEDGQLVIFSKKHRTHLHHGHQAVLDF